MKKKLTFSNGSEISFNSIDESIKGLSVSHLGISSDFVDLDKTFPTRISQSIVSKDTIWTQEYDSVIQEFSLQCLEKKKNIISDKIKEIVPDFNLDVDLNSSNPSVFRVYENEEEHYFLKTEEGLIRIVTFFLRNFGFEDGFRKTSMMYEENYY